MEDNTREENDFFYHEDDEDVEQYGDDGEEQTVIHTGGSHMPGFRNNVNPTNDNLAKGIKGKKGDQDNKEEDTKKNLNTRENNKNQTTNPLPGGGVSQSNNDNKNKEKDNKEKDKENGLQKKDDNNAKSGDKKSLPGKDKLKKGGAKNVTQSGGAAQAGKTGFKTVISLLSKHPVVLIGILVVLFLIIFIVLFAAIASGSTDYSSGYCVGQNFDISDIENTSVKTYTAVFDFAWNKDSGQYKFFSETPTYVDEEGFLRTGEDYIIALGTFFGTKKGTRYMIELENGTTFTASLGDTKSDAHTDPTHRYHVGDSDNPGDGSVLEFEMGCGSKIDPVEYGFNFSGDKPEACASVKEVNAVISNKFPGNIKSIKLLEGDNTCNFNGQFMERTTSIYTDKAALDLIWSIAPGAKLNYTVGLRYECVTYAKLRAIEILYNNTVLTSEQKEKAIEDLEWAQGNGWQWTAEDNSRLKKFGFDKTCTNFKAGSLVAFSGNGATCEDYPPQSPETTRCGHVGIIENVDEENGTVTFSDSYAALKGDVRFETYTIDRIKNAFGGCRGVTYLLNYLDEEEK